MSKNKHPMQPVQTENGVLRFRRNKIVEYLLEHGGFDMNKIAVLDFDDEDREQFAQLIGYSVSGYHELSYVSDRSAKAASAAGRKIGADVGGCRDHDCEIHKHR